MPTLPINQKILNALSAPQPIVVVYGGRGSGKSLAVGDFLTFEMDAKGYDVYCLREFQDSITDSVHRVFDSSISDRLKLDGWDVQQSTVIAPNGARTTYKGANRNPDAMQSAQGYLRSWFEEAHRASQASLDKLLPTILRNPGAKCIFTANPQSSGDPFSKRFITPYLDTLSKHGVYQDDLHYIVKVNWRDNPWWNDEQEALRAWDYANMSRPKYNWIWEGEFNDEVEDSIILQEWFEACIDAHKLDRLKAAFEPKGAIIAAHDPSDSGEDAKGYAVRHGSIIKRVCKKTTGDIEDGCAWATDNAIKDRADWFVWDGDGMGTGLKSQVSAAFKGKPIQFHMFKGSLSGSAQDNSDRVYLPLESDNKSTKTTYSETFYNNRAQFYILLANRCYNTYKAVVKGQYVDPDDMISFDSDGIEDMAGFKSEICRIPRKPNGRGLEQIMSKQEMAKIGIPSPNMADPVMMTMYMPPIKKAKPAKSHMRLSIA